MLIAGLGSILTTEVNGDKMGIVKCEAQFEPACGVGEWVIRIYIMKAKRNRLQATEKS